MIQTYGFHSYAKIARDYIYSESVYIPKNRGMSAPRVPCSEPEPES
jgi:hypothetical protein